MPKAISNTSPLLYLYRIGAINLLPKMFEEVWTAESVKIELLAGHNKGYDVPNPADYPWLKIVNPKSKFVNIQQILPYYVNQTKVFERAQI